MFVFLDESGNTGTNWLDADQPYFIYAGWAIENSKVFNAETRVTVLDSMSGGRELKSKEVLKRHRSEFYCLVNDMIDDGIGFPVFVVANKRFMLAGKIVETFFDIRTHPMIYNTIYSNRDLRKALATYISQNTNIISAFGGIYSGNSISLSDMKGINQLLQSHFETKYLFNVSAVLAGLTDDDLSNCIYEICSDSSTTNKWNTLTSPLLLQLLKNINLLGDAYNEKITVVVDELLGYSDVIANTQQYANVFAGNVDSISMQSSTGISTNNILIRAADWFSGFISKCFMKTEDWSKETGCKDFWQKLVAKDEALNKSGIELMDFDMPRGEYLSKITMLSDFTFKTCDDSVDTIKALFPRIR